MPRVDPLIVSLFVLIATTPLACDGGDDDDTAAGDDDDDSTGCITVNGVVPGYSTLQAAADVAVDGDVISVCSGTHPGSAVITAAVTLLGDGSAETWLVGDLNVDTLTIRDVSTVTIEGLALRGTADGLVLQDVAAATVDDLAVGGNIDVGVTVLRSTVTFSDLSLTGLAGSGVDASEADLTINRCTIDGASGYGIHLTDTTARISHCSVAGIVAADEDDSTSGSGIAAQLATLELDDSTIADCAWAGVLGLGADLQISETSIVECPRGVYGTNGGATGRSTVTDCTIDEASLVGVLLVGQDSHVAGNDLGVTDHGDHSYGIAVGAPAGEFTVRDNHITGYGGAGIWIQYPYSASMPGGGEAEILDNHVEQVERHGIVATSLDEVLLSSNTVEGIAWGGALLDGDFVDGMGLALQDIDTVHMDHNVVTEVDVAGIVVQRCDIDSVGDEVSAAGRWAVLVDDSTGTFDELVVTETSIVGLQTRNADITCSGCVFSGTRRAVSPDQLGELDPVFDPGYAVVLEGGTLTLLQATLSDNDDAHIMASDATLVVDSSSFTEDLEYAVYLDHSAAELRECLIEDARDGVRVFSYDAARQPGDISIAGTSFTGVGNGVVAYYLAGRLTVDGCEISDTVDLAADDSAGFAIHVVDPVADGASLVITDNNLHNLANTAIRAQGVTIDIHGSNTVGAVAGGGPSVDLDDVGGDVRALQIRNAGGQGMTVDDSSLTIVDCDIRQSSGANLVVVDSEVRIQDNTAISDGISDGLVLDGAVTGTVVDNVIQGNDQWGISCLSAAVTITSCSNLMGGNGAGDIKQDGGCSLSCVIQ